jgi:hypothetical protein
MPEYRLYFIRKDGHIAEPPKVLMCENCESFNGKQRDELLNREIFYSLKEAQIVIQQWRKHYNTIRSHSSLGY